MSDIANNSKVTVMWRGVVGLCSILGTLGIAAIFGYVRSADNKLTQTQTDVAQIKWELPVIKQTAVNDKAEVLKMLQNLEQRFQTKENLTDQDRKELGELRIHIALIKQKLQIP